MEPKLMPGAFFGWVALLASLGTLYFLTGHLLAIARLRAWDAFGETFAKTIIAPVRSLDQDGPFIRNRVIYCAAVSLFWPAVLAWNIFTLAVFALTIPVALVIIAADYATDALKNAATNAWRNARQTQHAAMRFLAASPETRTRRKIWRLLSQSRRLHETMACDRIRAADMDAKVNELTDLLPVQKTGSGPYRSVKLRAVG